MKRKSNSLMKVTRHAVSDERKLTCAFLTLGYPSLNVTEKLILEFEKAGVDIIELGFPFSDPMADGPTIQFSSEMALRKGVHLSDAFLLVKRLRRKGCRVPIMFFSYMNPVLHYGLKLFAKHARSAGFDGLIIPDMPPEEEHDLQHACAKEKLAQVFLVAPTTKPARAALIAKRSHGFIYYVSLRGVTGARKALPADLKKMLNVLKRHTSKPVLIGFGVSTPKQARNLSRLGHGVIVGSAIIDRLRRSGGRPGPAVHFMKQMVRAVHGAV